MATRERIFARDGRLCQCEACASSGKPLPAHEVDHRIPLQDGGADVDENLQSLNSACHKRKTKLEAERRAAESHVAPAQADSPLEFLTGVMNDVAQNPTLRVKAAIAAAQYVHTKRGDGGKKDEQAENARKVAERFAGTATPPRLVHSR